MKVSERFYTYLLYLWLIVIPRLWTTHSAVIISLMLLVPNFANTKQCKKVDKWLKPWHMSIHLRVFSESYLGSTNMTGFRCFLKIFASLCFVRKKPQYWKG